LTRPKIGLFSKNPSIGNVFFNEHVPGHVRDLVKNHHCSYEFDFEGLSNFNPSVEVLVQIQDVNVRI
jgi:hypothetical protein